MRSESARRLLAKTPEATKQKVREYADKLVAKRNRAKFKPGDVVESIATNKQYMVDAIENENAYYLCTEEMNMVWCFLNHRSQLTLIHRPKDKKKPKKTLEI